MTGPREGISWTPLVVGLPVHRREWCMDRWFDSLEAQDLPPRTKLLFCLSKPGDPTEKVILRRWRGVPGVADCEILYALGLPSFREDQKADDLRYCVLAHIRNRLLRIAAAEQPDYYLSWDSDIVLEPGALAEMMKIFDRAGQPGAHGRNAGAVGALVDMGGEVYPGNWSCMYLEGNDAHRYGETAMGAVLLKKRPAPVGVIMGVKLMTPRAYRDVRYADHPLGEDVGWAIQAEAMGVERWLCPSARGEHLYRIA